MTSGSGITAFLDPRLLQPRARLAQRLKRSETSPPQEKLTWTSSK
jgi:hypothetical protein